MVRDYFLTVKPLAFQMEVFRYVKTRCDTEGYSCPTWHSFSKYMGELKTLKLLIAINPPQEGDAPFEKRYFKLNPDLASSDMWLSPRRYLYG